jgi:alkanesulfonate monooxygenase SsuD/methylene tetrahydromethanopterin reductase-like flavin-dependent oxidoreductase (luciferase family)
MRVGLYYDLRNPPEWRRDWARLYASTLEAIERAEQLGIGSVWVTEHHMLEDGYTGQPLQVCAAIDFAEQAATVDILSNGRFEFGLGAGYRVPEFEVFGRDASQRFKVLEERVNEIRRLWAEGIATPPPVQDPLPLWLGMMGPRGARMAGRLDTGLLWLGDDLLEPYQQGLREGGHDPARARLAGLVNFILADDPEAAWGRIAPHIAYQRESYNRYGAEGRKQGTGVATVSGGPVDVKALRDRHGPPVSPRHDVLTADEAIARLKAWLGGRPVVDIFLWGTIAGMPDDLADRHTELVATVLAPALANL